MSVRLVVYVGNAFETFVFNVIGNGFDKFLLVYLIRKFGYDDSLARAVVELLYFALCAENNASPARSVSVSYSASAHDYAAGGEIGRGNVFQQFVNRYFGIIDDRNRAVDRFAEVVRRNVRSHTYGYAVRAVDEKVGVSRRQNNGLHSRIVEVRIEVYRFLIDFAEHFESGFTHSRFGVPVSRGGIAVDRTEVSVSVHERNVYRKVLRKTNESVVNGTVAVRVIFTENVADDGGALFIRFIGR